MQAKYMDLLGDGDVKHWYENFAAKSILTATVYLRALGLYCALNNTSLSWYTFPFLSILEFKVFRHKLSIFAKTVLELINPYLKELFD